MAKQDCQITFLDHSGTPQLYHPETNADQVVTGERYRVPEISDITNWSDRSAELINARKGESNLRKKIDNIDKALQPAALLNSIKEVDGSGTGLDADKVDGKDVNDDARDTNTLWTAQKIYTELEKKVNSTEVVSEATPNKLLLLNSQRKLEADVQGNSDTATRWNSPVRITFSGDVAGNISLQGDENAVETSLTVIDNSHNHGKISKGSNTVETSSDANIADFKKDERVLSSIDREGNFTGSAKKIDGKAVSDEEETGVLWTCDKIISEMDKLKALFSEVVQVEQEERTITCGSLKIKYGAVALETRTQLSVEFEEPFETVLFSNHSLETSDISLNCVKLPGEDTTGIQFLLNKPALNGKIHWFVVGM